MNPTFQGRLLIAAAVLGLSVNTLAADSNPYDQVRAAISARDYAKELNLLKPLVEKGDAEAQFYLGAMYEAGSGVDLDYKEAMRLYGLAAAQGYSYAQINLGLMYGNGKGGPINYEEAARLYGQAAAQGDKTGQFFLAVAYYDGHGVPQDYREAARLFRILADQGNQQAQYFLGNLYAEGHGFPQDDQEAARWYQLSAAQGNAGAILALKNLGKPVPNVAGAPTTVAQAAPAPIAQAAPALPALDADIDKEIERAEAMNQNRDFSGAVALLSRLRFSSAVIGSPGTRKARVLNELGYAYNETKDYLNARFVLDEALQLNPENFAALVNRSITLGNVGQLDASQQDLLHAQRIAPANYRDQVASMLKKIAEARNASAAPAGNSGPAYSNSAPANPNSVNDTFIRNQERINRENCARAASGANIACNQ